MDQERFEAAADLVLLRVNRLDADPHALRDFVGLEAFTVIERDELAILVAELGEDFRHDADLLAENAHVVGIGQLRGEPFGFAQAAALRLDRKSTRLNSSH